MAYFSMKNTKAKYTELKIPGGYDLKFIILGGKDLNRKYLLATSTYTYDMSAIMLRNFIHISFKLSNHLKDIHIFTGAQKLFY